MTNTPNLPDAANRQIALENEMDELANDIDPIDPIGALMTIADYMDLDLIEVLRKLQSGIRFKFGEESIIQDILESSQSNWDRSLARLIRCIEIENEISEL